jgi:hypothetical protein
VRNSLPILVDLVHAFGHTLLDHRLISRPSDEGLSEVERHVAEVVAKMQPGTPAASMRFRPSQLEWIGGDATWKTEEEGGARTGRNERHGAVDVIIISPTVVLHMWALLLRWHELQAPRADTQISFPRRHKLQGSSCWSLGTRGQQRYGHIATGPMSCLQLGRHSTIEPSPRAKRISQTGGVMKLTAGRSR